MPLLNPPGHIVETKVVAVTVGVVLRLKALRVALMPGVAFLGWRSGLADIGVFSNGLLDCRFDALVSGRAKGSLYILLAEFYINTRTSPDLTLSPSRMKKTSGVPHLASTRND